MLRLRTLLNCASVSGATSASRKSFKALSAAEVNELKTKLVKTDIVPFINRLWRKAYRRGEIFRRLHGFWASGTRSQLVADIAAGDSALLEADTWLADAIGSCLDRSSAAVVSSSSSANQPASNKTCMPRPKASPRSSASPPSHATSQAPP